MASDYNEAIRIRNIDHSRQPYNTYPANYPPRAGLGDSPYRHQERAIITEYDDNHYQHRDREYDDNLHRHQNRGPREPHAIPGENYCRGPEVYTRQFTGPEIQSQLADQRRRVESEIVESPSPAVIQPADDPSPQHVPPNGYDPSLQPTPPDGNDTHMHNSSRPGIRTALITSVVPENSLMGEHQSYHNNITGEEAVRRLRRHGGNCYLTHYSEIQMCYILSVYQRTPTRTTKHFKIICTGGECRIDGKMKTFGDIDQLLVHYEGNRIDPAFPNIGERCTENCPHHRSTCIIL